MTQHPTGSKRRSGSRRSLRRSAGLLVALAVCVVGFGACDKSLPTDPQRQTPTTQTPGGQAAATSTITFSSGLTSEMDAGDTVTFTVTVQTSQTTLPTQVALSTSMGNFGTSASDPTSATETLSLSSSSGGVSTLTTGTITFYAGVTTGTASITAAVGSATLTQSVTISQPDALFLQTISPNFGPPTGGTTVTITGVGFPAVASTDTTSPLPQVSFGGALGTVSRPTTSTSLTVTTPASSTEVSSGSSLVVDVIVKVPETTTRTAQSDTLSGAFTYTTGSDGNGGGNAVPPSIRSVSPTEGANAGGYSMTINGTNFETGTTSGAFNVEVRFGSGSTPSTFDGNSATVTAVSSTAITVTVPAATSSLQSSAVDLLVRNKTSGLAVVAQKIFTYLGEGSVLDIDPRDAPYTGDLSASNNQLTVSLSATPTASSLQVEFGNTFQATCPQTTGTVICSFSGSSIIFDSIQSVTVSSCSPPSGVVTVTDPSTGETSTGPNFSYTADTPRITSVSPTSAVENTITSSTTLTLSGSFSTIEATSQTQVLVDGVAATIQSMDATTLVVTLPSFTGTFPSADCTTSTGAAGTQLASSAVDVTVTFLNTDCTTTASSIFTYEPSDTTCRVTATAPVAAFSFVVGPTGISPPNNPLTVEFTDTSTGDPTSLTWFFGDGATASCTTAGCTVTHTYSAAGTYTVILQASNSAGTDSFSQDITLGDAPISSFSFTPTNPAAGSTVTFTDASTGGTPTDLVWTFGDGNTGTCSPAGCSVTNAYATAGIYTVTLEALNNAGSDTSTQTITVGSAPLANFSFSPAMPTAGSAVTFTDTSAGDPTTLVWDFGDGNTDTCVSAGCGVSNTYAVAGTYTVTLTAQNGVGSTTNQQTITVN